MRGRTVAAMLCSPIQIRPGVEGQSRGRKLVRNIQFFALKVSGFRPSSTVSHSPDLSVLLKK